MRVTKWGEYGILCSLYLARAGVDGSIGAAELAEYHSIPLQYAQQILQRLRRGNIIKSVRGPGGGYMLAAPSEQITLRDILMATEGNTFSVVCENHSIKTPVCSNPEDCALHNVWYELKESIDQILAQHTLAALTTAQAQCACNTRNDKRSCNEICAVGTEV